MNIQSMVADKFYPGDAETLGVSVINMLNEVADFAYLPVPKAIIVPHAGYIYSGSVAASAYACLVRAKRIIKRVVLLAPAHQYPVDGIATTAASGYETPLNPVEIDQKAIAGLSFPFLNVVEEAFKNEHSVEVQLPFLQIVLGNDFSLLPFLVGNSNGDQTEALLEALWGGPETLIIISSDLSHYHSYKEAKALDAGTAKAILSLNPEGLSADSACGEISIKGLLKVAAKKNMHMTQLDLRNSGDTSPLKDQVVGYGAFHLG